MHFDLIQSLSLAGDAAIPNDDRAGAGERLAWVIDGATDLGPPGLVGPRGGAAWIALEADRAFAAAPDAPLGEICAGVIATLAARFAAIRTREPLERWELPSAAFLAVRLEDGALDVAWFADCVALLAGERIGPAAVRDAEHAATARIIDPDAAKPMADPATIADRRTQRDGPRAVLGVEGDTAFQTSRHRCAVGDDLLLMSDGFAALIDAYGAYDAAGLMAAVRAGGLAPLAARLRAIEAEPGTLARFPRFKRSDDATALWLRIGG